MYDLVMLLSGIGGVTQILLPFRGGSDPLSAK